MQEETTLPEAQSGDTEAQSGENNAVSSGTSNAPAAQPNAPKPHTPSGQKPPQVNADTPNTPESPEANDEIILTPVPPTEVKPDPKKEITVSVSVDCHTAIEWGILEKKPELKGRLPENGAILSGEVTVKEGESALKALKKALKKNRVAINESDGYIRSIAGLSEFDCGRSSGWMYRVNGKFPNISSADYPLKDGDKIEFLYTCKMGDIAS